MSEKSPTLRLIQIMWPWIAALVVVNTVVMTWVGSSSRVSMWADALPLVSGLVSMMAVAAGAGPLVSESIKAKAGRVREE